MLLAYKIGRAKTHEDNDATTQRNTIGIGV